MRITTRGFLLCGVLAGAGCGMFRGSDQQTMPLRVSEDLPAAVGKVTVEPGEMGNRQLQIAVKHLAPASRVKPGASTYVVWLQPRAAGGNPVNLGALQVNEDLEGQFNTTTTFSDFDIFITAEARPNVTEPSEPQMLGASVRPRERTIR